MITPSNLPAQTTLFQAQILVTKPRARTTKSIDRWRDDVSQESRWSARISWPWRIPAAAFILKGLHTGGNPWMFCDCFCVYNCIYFMSWRWTGKTFTTPNWWSPSPSRPSWDSSSPGAVAVPPRWAAPAPRPWPSAGRCASCGRRGARSRPRRPPGCAVGRSGGANASPGAWALGDGENIAKGPLDDHP